MKKGHEVMTQSKPVPYTYQARILQRLHGNIVQNTLHFTGGGLPQNDYETAATLGATVAQAWEDSFYPFLSQDLTIETVEVKFLGDYDGVTATTLASGSGSVSNASLPGSVAYCLTLRSSFSGRSRRGRVYLAGIPESIVTGNLVSAGFFADMQGAGVEFMQAMQAWSLYGNLSIVSRYINKAERLVPLTTIVMNMGPTDLRVDSMRRRLS